MTPKISLRDIDIIISFRAASSERTENLYTTLQHLDHTYIDYQVLIMEADGSPKFDWEKLKDRKISHLFTYKIGPFPKAYLYNLGTRLSRSKVICFHDADTISKPAVLKFCVDDLLDNNASDVLCPYEQMYNIQGETRAQFGQHFNYSIFEEFDPNILHADISLLYSTNNGGVVVFRKSKYIEIGGYNPLFEGWGGEDDELLIRARRLGLRWNSITKVSLMHLNHDMPTRDKMVESSRDSANIKSVEATQNMTEDDLQLLVENLRRNFA